MIRVGVVGLGKMGVLHASILSLLPDVNLVAICEKNFVVRRFSKKILNDVPVVGQMKHLSGLGLDAVYITTPVASHYGLVREVFSEGIARNVFVEKPLASKYSESQELCHLVEQYDGVNMVGYNRRFAATFKKTKQMLDQGTLGSIASFEAHAYSDDFSGVTNTQRHSIARGGVIVDLGCHAIDLANWLFGELEVKSVEIESANGRGFEDSAHFNVTTPDGVTGFLSISWSMEKYRLPTVGLQVKGTKGTIEADEDEVEFRPHDGKSIKWYRSDLGDTVPFFLGESSYVREDESFVRAVVSGLACEPDFRAASRVDQVVEQVRDRAKEDGWKATPAGRR